LKIFVLLHITKTVICHWLKSQNFTKFLGRFFEVSLRALNIFQIFFITFPETKQSRQSLFIFEIFAGEYKVSGNGFQNFHNIPYLDKGYQRFESTYHSHWDPQKLFIETFLNKKSNTGKPTNYSQYLFFEISNQFVSFHFYKGQNFTKESFKTKTKNYKITSQKNHHQKLN
jgi:hypothetical protein